MERSKYRCADCGCYVMREDVHVINGLGYCKACARRLAKSIHDLDNVDLEVLSIDEWKRKRTGQVK
jgi:late competence protein required for DNA uptake (superfamily II DNA/RNA helicase)